MLRHACILAASSLLACSSGDIAVGKSQAEELKTRADGSPTGDGTTCSVDGIAWGGSTGTASPGAPASPPGTTTSSGTGGGTATPPPTGTEPSTTTYSVGASFPAPDGCNTCKCAPDGVWCTVQPCTGGGGTGGGGASCTVDGKTYPDGASFPSSDGCNKCSCNNGMAACTEMACATPPPVSVCTYGGKTYNAGDSFASTDGCNTCSCMADGSVACTMRACAKP